MKGFFRNSLLSFASLAKVLLLSKWFGALKLKERPVKTRCLIIGNGPSFATTLQLHESSLEQYELVCVNGFVLSEYYVKIKPGFYIINASVFFQPDEKLSQLYIDLRNNIFSKLEQDTSWKMNLMVPFMAKKSNAFKMLLQKNKNILPLYFNQTPVEGFSGVSHALFAMKLGIPRPHNVLIPAIMNMIALHFKEISIVGADHSWLAEISVNENNEALVNQKHFYDESTSSPQKMQDYIARPRRLHEVIHKFYLSFKGYWDIKAYAAAKKVTIYNASEVSMIDAFDRKKLTR